MGEQHLNAFAITARLLKCVGLGHRTGNVTGLLVDAAREFYVTEPSDSIAIFSGQIWQSSVLAR